jgi:hypothetical protein
MWIEKFKSDLLWYFIFADSHSVFKIIADYSSEELGVLLNMLKVPELRSLCQTFRIPSATQPKSKLIQALLAYGRTQQTISGNERSDSASLIKSRYTVVYPTPKH